MEREGEGGGGDAFCCLTCPTSSRQPVSKDALDNKNYKQRGSNGFPGLKMKKKEEKKKNGDLAGPDNRCSDVCLA